MCCCNGWLAALEFPRSRFRSDPDSGADVATTFLSRAEVTLISSGAPHLNGVDAPAPAWVVSFGLRLYPLAIRVSFELVLTLIVQVMSR